MAQVSKQLLVTKKIPIDTSTELLYTLDLAIAEQNCLKKDYEKGLKIYRETLPKLPLNERSAALNRYINFALKHASELFSEKKFLEALEIYRDLINHTGFPVTIYKNIGLCMKALGNADMAIKFLKKFEEVSPDKEDVYVYLADIIYTDIKDNCKAIEYYEKALGKNKNNYSIYNMLGHLYSTCYQDKYKDKQIEYLTKAFELAPNNRIVVKNLAYVYGKFDETQKADEFYSKLMYLNPTHSDLHAYGAYLVKHKRFTEGFKFLQHRFQKEDLDKAKFPEFFNNKKKRWNIKCNISGKHLLIHYEQGFGDTIMFARYIKEAKELCKKVSLVIQKPLLELFEDSNLGIDIYSGEQAKDLQYDYYIPMMDLPILCNATSDNIPQSKGYLSVPKTKAKEYKEKYINKNSKLKIGIAYEGSLMSKETDRDIALEYLYPLMDLPDVEVYSFQVDDLTRQMDRIPENLNLIRLGKTFKNWEDTACAMMNMDLIVTTDNGVMNLAGALGVKTFGLFNTITEWRWFQTQGKDVAWYKSIKPFQAPTSRAWEIPIEKILKEIEIIRCKKIAKKIKSN